MSCNSGDLNVFRLLGDASHTLSKCILIFSIHRNRSTEGVSLITQALYCMVFFSRYLDTVYTFVTALWWITMLKFFYILSSLYILFLMLRLYARTREREKSWKLGAACLVGSAIGAPLSMLIFKGKECWGVIELLRIFSLILESVCVLPQLLLLRQTTVPTVIDSYYLLTLGSYRAFYILNWIWREVEGKKNPPDIVSIIYGVIQTAFYIDFAWVYYSRQRVKLRNGGLVDAEDLRAGWLLRTVFGQKTLVPQDDDDEENAPALGGPVNGDARQSARRGGSAKWGARGISVSADDGALDHEDEDAFEDQEEGVVSRDSDRNIGKGVDRDAKMRDPDELARILDDDDDEDDDEGTLPTSSASASVAVGNGSEWREGGKK